MLNLIETSLLQAIAPTLPQGTKLVAGLIIPPVAAPVVNITVTSLQTRRFTENNEESKRQPAFLMKRISLTGDGKLLDFSLPENAIGDVIEVELSPGRLAKPGDDYWLEQRTLKFYTPPSGTFTVLLRSVPASGYQQSCTCHGIVNIDVWGDQTTVVDDYLTPALASTLAFFLGLERMELVKANTTGFSLRLIKPLIELDALECTQVPTSPLICNRARLRLTGTWELVLALGTPPQTGIIQEISGKLEITEGAASMENFKISG